MKLGAIDFIAKPLSPITLRQVVAELIHRNSSTRDAFEDDIALEHVTASTQFKKNLVHAKYALNRRLFEEAEVYLKQALALEMLSDEGHNLKGVLHELRNEHDDSYREYKAALKADRHYEPAKHNMTRYYERFTFGSSTVPVDTGES